MSSPKSEVKSPSDTVMELVPKLGGMPKTLTADEVAKKNMPSGRSAAPESFRPAGNGGSGDK